MDGSSFLASFSSDHEIRFNGGTIDSFPVKGEKVSVKGAFINDVTQIWTIF